MRSVLHVVVEGKQLLIVIELGRIQLGNTGADASRTAKTDKDQAVGSATERADVSVGEFAYFQLRHPDRDRLMSASTAFLFTVLLHLYI